MFVFMKRIIILFVALNFVSCGIFNKKGKTLKLKNQYVILSQSKNAEANKQSILSGFIFDNETNEVLNNAEIRLKNTKYKTEVNDKGYFYLRIPEGEYVLVISHPFISNVETKKIKAKKGFRTEFLFHLKVD